VTNTAHTSAEQVADLLEGNLSAGEAMSVNAHLAGCDHCSDLRDAMLDVTAVLAAEGASVEPMPADIATSLQQAITEASAGAGTLDQGRIDNLPRPRSRRPMAWLAGAAAAVVLASAGVAGWRTLLQSGAGSSSSATAQQNQYNARHDAAAPTGGAAGSGTRPGPASSVARGRLDPFRPGSGASLLPGQVAEAARTLTGYHRLVEDVQPGTLPCATPSGNGPFAVVRWHGGPAVLHAEPSTRTATILDCPTASRVLFSTGY